MIRSAMTMTACAVVALAPLPTAYAETFSGNFALLIDGRYDFHTWIWAVRSCAPASEGCVRVQAISQPNAKAFAYAEDAHLVDGRYTLTVDVPDGLRCGNVYYGPVIATHDVYTWDALTRSGTLSSSFAAGCDGAPGGTFTYPFSLVVA